MQVKKRDGAKVPFDRGRITKAVLAAFSDAKESNISEVDTIVDTIIESLTSIDYGDLYSIENISDTTENVLLDYGYHEVAKRYISYRTKRAMLRAGREKPDTTAIAEYIHYSKYARGNESRRDTVRRVMDMHRRRGYDVSDIEEAINKGWIVPSMRSLQFGGEAIELCHNRMYNCCFTHVNRLRVFDEIMYQLLCGCGVGYSVQQHHVDMLPKILSQGNTVIHHSAGDSIEGWASAVRAMVEGTFGGHWVEIDYSKIRPQGSPIKTSGGKAPGHLGLRKALENIRRVMQGAAGRSLRPIEAHDMICYIAEAVLSGGIRRSALISLFDDSEMMYAKQTYVPHRAMANNSLVVLRSDPDAKEKVARCMDLAAEGYGEPGFFLTDNKEWGTNPCGEIGLNPPQEGFAFCNLTEINMAALSTREEWLEACRLATKLGTIQCGYTDFKYIHPSSCERAREEALLGVSITGVMDTKLDLSLLREGANVCVEWNAANATDYGVNPSKRITCVKPSGTASLWLGAVSSGIHCHHSKRYFRRVTCNHGETVFEHFKAYNPHMVEDRGNGLTGLVFPIETDGRVGVKDTEFLDIVKQVYNDWVIPGSKTQLTHNVSCTCTVTDEHKVREWLYNNLDCIAAISFVPDDVDKKYQYAPRERVLEGDESYWNLLIRDYIHVDYSKMSHVETNRTLDAACVGGSCEI